MSHARTAIRCALAALFAFTGGSALAATPVYVVGTLYKRHEQAPRYALADLARVIRAIRPQVLVLDVTPTELEKKQVFPGKIEYPGVIFPLLADTNLIAYASEPGEPMFGEIVQATIRAFDDFRTTRPALSEALEGHDKATYAVLMQSWQSPADAHGGLAETAIAAHAALQDALVGPLAADGRRRWNEHIADVAARAAREHAGQRVLVLTGIENRGPVVGLLRAKPGVELVEMEPWLRRHAAPATSGH
jgi:hypothetical protein